MADHQALNYYRVFSLLIASEIPLPELLPAERGDPDVRIAWGETPRLANESEGYTVAEGGTLLTVEKAGRFWIENGRSITVEPVASGSERNLRLYLLGSAKGALLHQAGLLPLHANAVEVDGKAILFMGHPGAGKSTMAAWFHDRGFRILSDDVCVVTFDGIGGPLAHPGIPRLRLWREALEASGRSSEGYDLAFDESDKFNVPVAAEASGTALPLGCVYLLARAADGAAGSVERLQGVAAIDALVANTYRGGYLPLIGGTRGHLIACVDLARQVPLFLAERRWGYSHYEQEAEALLAHARSVERQA